MKRISPKKKRGKRKNKMSTKRMDANQSYLLVFFNDCFAREERQTFLVCNFHEKETSITGEASCFYK